MEKKTKKKKKKQLLRVILCHTNLTMPSSLSLLLVSLFVILLISVASAQDDFQESPLNEEALMNSTLAACVRPVVL